MALGDVYVTVPELKARLGIQDDNDDTRLLSAVKAASRGIDKVTNRQFNDAGSATSRVFQPDTADRAEVDDFSTTTGLIIQTDTALDQTFSQTWTSRDYELRPLNGIVDGEPGWPYWHLSAIGTQWFPIPRGWPAPRATLRVTARWGWAAVPDAIKEACQICAEEIFKLRDAPFGVAGFADYGAVRVRQNPIACSMISPYRRTPVLVA
jgi:hypothetical protein